MTHSLLSLFPLQIPELPLRAIKYQPNVTLSFVLLNEDSAEGGYVKSWDIREAIKGESRSSAVGLDYGEGAEKADANDDRTHPTPPGPTEGYI